MDSRRELCDTDPVTRKRDYHRHYNRRYRVTHRETINQRQRARRARDPEYVTAGGLGRRQRQILRMAYDRAQGGEGNAPRPGSVLLHRDIFKELYGWTITPGPWGEWFNPVEIGLADYRRASVAVTKAITALRKRGLLQRGERRGHLLLTTDGYLLAQTLAAQHQAAVVTETSASMQCTLFPLTGTD